MNILCPDCHTSLSVSEGVRIVRCASCGFEADVSTLGTAPGAPLLPVVRDMSGDTLGPYRLESMIGSGGMGVVYKARDTRDDRPVAVKVLNLDYQWKQEEFVQRFKREIKALGRLDHPGIVRILDSGEEGGIHFLVTEFVNGMNLADLLKTGPIKIEDTVRIMTDVCEAINFAHEQGVVHRDIKPANIIIVGNKAKILDFGLAQVTGKGSTITTLTRTNLAMGTFNYLSPEQRLNAKSVDHRSDIFSLGVVFYEMLTGTLPLGSFAPPSKVRSEAPKKCDRIVTRSLQSSPDLRYKDASAFCADVRQIVARSDSPFLRRKAILAIAASLAVGIGLAFVFLGRVSSPAEQEGTVDSVKVNIDSQVRNLNVESQTAVQRPKNSSASKAQAQQEAPAEPEMPPSQQAATGILSNANDNAFDVPKKAAPGSSEDTKVKASKVVRSSAGSKKKTTQKNDVQKGASSKKGTSASDLQEILKPDSKPDSKADSKAASKFESKSKFGSK